MLAVSAPQAPAEDSRFGYEFKWDGVRVLCFLNGGVKPRLISRNLLDITRRYPELWGLGEALEGRDVVLDGEIVALDESGRPSFSRLQRRMHVDNPQPALLRDVPVFYVLFDVLYADGISTVDQSYRERRHLLEDLAVEGPAWMITPAQEGNGRAMLDVARRGGLEGIIAKRLDSVYEPGRRSASWLKIKVIHGQEFVIGGWVPEAGGGAHANRVSSLLVGYWDYPGRGKPRGLRYAGGVGTGFTAATHDMLVPKLRRLKTNSNPFAESVSKRQALFVRPELVAEIEFRRWPEGGAIQQAAFKGLRSDKDSRNVVKEDHADCSM